MKSVTWYELGKFCFISIMLLELSACASTNEAGAYYNYNQSKITPNKYIVVFDSPTTDDARLATQKTAQKLAQLNNCTSFKIDELEIGNHDVPVNKNTVSPNNFLGNPFLHSYSQQIAIATMEEPDYVSVSTVKSQINLIGCKNK